VSEKILIIKLGALGDLVLVTPFIRHIQQAHENAEIWLLTTPPFAELFSAWPKLKVKALLRSELLRMVAWVRRQGFQRIYDFQCNDRSALVCALSGVVERVGERRRFFAYTHYPPGRYSKQTPAFERHNAALVSAGLAPAEPKLWLPTTDAARDKVKLWLSERRLDRKSFVLCHAGSSARWPSKRWPYFAELADALADKGITVVWLGAGEDAQTNHALAARQGLDATDCFSIPEMAELGRYARFAVTNDSAPMHVLASAGIPVYGLFGPTNWQRSHALGQADRALYSTTACPACAAKAYADTKGHCCLSSISAQQVLQRLRADNFV
jgi:ADP-heptose:LPS heptosyltransferase